MTEELKNILLNSCRYRNFILLQDPKPFSVLFKDVNFKCVQLHSTSIYNCENGGKNIVGFSGQFSWENNVLESLDGDIYSEDMMVLGCEYLKNGLDILVGEEW